MRKTAIAALVLICLAVLGRPAAAGLRPDQRSALQQSIADRYHLTQLGTGVWGVRGNPNQVRRAGGVVVIRQGGLSGSLERNQVASFAIRDGQPPKLYAGKGDQPIRVGEKFYVHSVALGPDVISLGMLSVALIPTPSSTGQLWLTLSFFFPQQVLERGDITSVYRTLDQWLLPEGSFQPATEAAAAAPVARPVPAAPSDLKPGMTREQVIASLGPPSKETSFGTKSWLIYPAMVVVLEDGKLAGVDQTSQPPARVSLASDPPGADVYLDGNFVGSTPSVLPLPPGSHKLEVKAAGFKPWSRQIQALPGGEINLKATLEKQ